MTRMDVRVPAWITVLISILSLCAGIVVGSNTRNQDRHITENTVSYKITVESDGNLEEPVKVFTGLDHWVIIFRDGESYRKAKSKAIDILIGEKIKAEHGSNE